MSQTFLTSDEIYAIDKLTEVNLADYLLTLSVEKRALVSHIFSKNRSLMALKVISDEKEEGVKRLRQILDENGVAYV